MHEHDLPIKYTDMGIYEILFKTADTKSYYEGGSIYP